MAVPEPNKAWVDIGCGNGTFTEQIHTKHSPSEIRLDPSPEQIDFALQRIDSSDVSFQVGDAMELPFDDDQFTTRPWRWSCSPYLIQPPG